VDHVDADVFSIAKKARNKELGCGGNPAEAIVVERNIRRRPSGASLHFDKGEHLATAGHEVDLADRSAHALAEHRPALASEEPGGKVLGSPAAALGFGAGFGQRPSSSARS
jgi:hypothetical protein